VLGPWDLKIILSSKPHWSCGPQAFGLCSLFLLAMKFFSFVGGPHPPPPKKKKKKKKPPLVCRWKPCRPSATKLDLGVPTGCQSSICCASEKGKKQREVGTNYNGWEGSNWELPGGGAGVVQWSDGTQTTVLLVTASLVRKKEPPLNGAPPISSHANTHAHLRTHFLFLHCPVHATRGLKKSL
jgi:hypothetical protein